MEKIKNSKAKLIGTGSIIALILLIYLLRGWWIPKIIIGLGGYVNKEVTIEYIEGDIDTSAVFTAYVKRKGIILNPKPKVIKKDSFIYRKIIVKDTDTIWKEKEIVNVDSLYHFEVGVKDSIIDGKMDIYNKPDGNLFGADLTYALRLLKQTDTIKETTTLSNCVPKNYISLGASMNNLSMPGVSLGYSTKKNWEFQGNYSKNVFNTPVYNGGDKVQVIGTITISKKW